MRYLNLWQTELPPVLDVTRGPINGAAQAAHAGRADINQASAGSRTAQSAAAPPEPMPADSQQSADQIAAETSRTEREGVAWVPFVAGKCPLPPETKFFTMCEGVECGPWIATEGMQWGNPNVTHYRLANPVSRGPCTLPPDHPHAELERLWRSDASLRRWWRCGKRWFECDLDDAAFHVENVYHVGHVAPQEAA